MRESLQDRRAVPSTGCEPRPGHGRGQEDRLAGPAGARPRRPGQLARPHRHDHGHVDGGPDPPLQAGHRGLPGAAGPGLRRRSSRRAASSACTSSATAAPGPYRVHFRDPSFTNLQAVPAMCEGGMVADVIAAVASASTRSWAASTADALSHRQTRRPPRRPHGRRSPARPAGPREIIARYPRPRSALLPMLHLVQAEEGYVTPDGIAFCAEQLGLTKAEVAAVATFYTMYKRRPTGDYHVGVCTNTLCAVMGGDAIFAALEGPPRRRQRRDHRRRQGHASSTSSATRPATTRRS